MFMLTQEFLKEQFLVCSCSYYISMTSLLIFLPTSDFLQMTACVLYRVIHSEQDHHLLQQILNLIIQWTELWQMSLNTDKCIILICSRSTSPPEFQYYINSNTLNRTNQHTYLGVLFHSFMSFSLHINNIASNAVKSLNFVRRNLSKCDGSVKSAAYLGLIRPKLEYVSAVWDPHLKYQKI